MPHAPTKANSSISRQRLAVTVAAIRAAVGERAFHVSETEARGIAADRVERACSAGLLTRVGKGWYVVAAGEEAVSDDAGCRGGWPNRGLNRVTRGRLRARGDRAEAVLCGVSAAAVWGLPIPPGVHASPGLHLLRTPDERSWGGRRDYDTIHRWRMPEEFITTGPHGGGITDPFQTALDLSRGLCMPFALAPLDAAMRHAVASGVLLGVARELLDARVGEFRGRPGSRGAVWAAALVHPGSESPLESIVRGRIVEVGLPTPALQVNVVGQSGRRYRCDMGLRRPGDPPGTHGLLIEADGLGKYLIPEDLATEKRRQHDIEATGREVLRVLYAEAVHAPDSFLDRLRQIIGRGA